MKLSLTFAAAAIAMSLLAVGPAHATETIVSNQQGWITQGGLNNGALAGGNYVLGSCCGGGEYRDFFGFAIPAGIGSVSGASFVVETRTVALAQSPTLSVGFTSGTPGSFADLGTGTQYATRVFTGSDSDQTVTITLDAAALADIAAAAGGEFYITGRITSPATFGTTDPLQFIFGNTEGRSARLVITAVPEPAALLLLGTGLPLLLTVRRRGQRRPV